VSHTRHLICSLICLCAEHRPRRPLQLTRRGIKHRTSESAQPSLRPRPSSIQTLHQMSLNQQPNSAHVPQEAAPPVSRYNSPTTYDNVLQVSGASLRAPSRPDRMQEGAPHWLTALCGRVFKGLATFLKMQRPFGTQEEAPFPAAHHQASPEADSVRPTECEYTCSVRKC
jgi:hypothetical protein